MGTRIECVKIGIFARPARVRFEIVFDSVESFALHDEAEVGTLPISHFVRDEEVQMTVITGNIPVPLKVRTTRRKAKLVVHSSAD